MKARTIALLLILAVLCAAVPQVRNAFLRGLGYSAAREIVHAATHHR